jgi:hypothetical protein
MLGILEHSWKTLALTKPVALAALFALTAPVAAHADPRYDACFSRCKPEDAYHCSHWCSLAYTRWKWRQLQSGGETPEVGRQAAEARPSPARKPKRRWQTIVAVSYKKIELSKTTLSGNESRIAAMNYVNADCSGGPLPAVRIVSQPSSGELRLEPIKYAVDRQAKNHRAHCNGKIVDAIAVFYRSKEQYVGADKVVLDVDFKHGGVNRYTYAIDVR